MRYFRIPSFTGIEAHRDDNDRGSLRVVEGCMPHGPGGLRSAPVWKKVGDVDLFSSNHYNKVTGADDGKGNSAVYVSRGGEVHDLVVFSTEHTELVSLGSCYDIVNPIGVYGKEKAAITPIGNRLYAMGDGSAEASYIGKGPPAYETTQVFPEERLYQQEWSRFPNCRFYVQGPKKTIFAAGNPEKPLTVYISEPGGLTNPVRDSPYTDGPLSTVKIMASNASEITALSTRGDQVVVHTDKGCHLLYAPKADQAETGYRVEQAPATNFSGAVNVQVVAGESGTQPYWLGHDGQIHKDDAAKRGAEDFEDYSDPKEASAKSKGLWEKEHPTDLTDSFATYSSQAGMYWLYVKNEVYSEAMSLLKPGVPHSLLSQITPEAPGTPSNLDSEVTINPPGVVSRFTAIITSIDPPGVPSRFTATIPTPNVPSGLTITFKPSIPGIPTAFSAALRHNAPGVPTIDSIAVQHSLPSVPQQLQASVEHDIPGVPTALSSQINLTTNPPSVPQSLSFDVEHDIPGVPTIRSTVVQDDIPGVPTIESIAVQHDAPGVPTNFSPTLEHDVPGVPTNFSSALEHDVPGVPANLTGREVFVIQQWVQSHATTNWNNPVMGQVVYQSGGATVTKLLAVYNSTSKEWVFFSPPDKVD